MNVDTVDDLIDLIGTLSGLCEDLSQRVTALENRLSDPDRQKYTKELGNLKKSSIYAQTFQALQRLREQLLRDRQ